MDEDNNNGGSNEKKEIGDILFDWKRKADNLWYHYKMAIIAGIAFLALIIFAISQCAAKIPGDANIAYIGSKNFNSDEYEDLQNNLNEMVGEDLNGDNKVYAEFHNFLYMTDRQIEDDRAAGNVVDVQSLLVVQTRINLELADGNIIIYFIDPEVYKQLKKTGVFMSLEDSLGYVPEESFDDCAVKLKDLPCWEYYAGIGSLPENTVLTVRERQISETDKETDERYMRNLSTFKRLVEFDGIEEQ